VGPGRTGNPGTGATRHMNIFYQYVQ
jgi:hypothetical protein